MRWSKFRFSIDDISQLSEQRALLQPQSEPIFYAIHVFKKYKQVN